VEAGTKNQSVIATARMAGSNPDKMPDRHGAMRRAMTSLETDTLYVSGPD
jgi:hypothetical protein